MGFVGNAAYAIMLVGSIAACAILAPIYLNYLCHLLLTVFSETAAGADDIQWSEEPIFDRWRKLAWCVAALGICAAFSLMFAVPSLFISPLVGVIAFGVLLSIFFPLALVSGTLAPDLLGPLHGEAYLAIFRWPRAWLVAWLWGTPFAAGACVCLFATMMWTPTAAIGLGVLVPPAVFLFARSWGCFTWLATAGNRRSKKKKMTAEASVAAQSVDPWSAPPLEAAEEAIPELDVEEWSGAPEDPEDEWATEKKPYGLAAETASPDADKMVRMEDYLAVDRKLEAARDEATARYDRKPTFSKAMGSRIPAVFLRPGVAGHVLVLGLFTWVQFALLAAVVWMIGMMR